MEILDFVLEKCRSGISKDEVEKEMGTDGVVNETKDIRYKSQNAIELRYDKKYMELEGSLWFIFINDIMKKASWYYIGRTSEDVMDKIAEMSEIIVTEMGEPMEKVLDESIGGEYKWKLENGDICSFECDIIDGWIHLLITVSEL